MRVELYPCFYLLYKLKNNHMFWVIQVELSSDDLSDYIDQINSSREQYYLVKRYVYNVKKELATKQFTTFKQRKTDIIINRSV